MKSLPSDVHRLALELQIMAGGQRMQQLLRLTRADLSADTFTLFDPKGSFIATATIDDIRTMLTQCVRSEKFSPGYRATVVKSGQLKQILERLQVLRDAQAPDDEDKFHQPVTIDVPQCNTCVHRLTATTCAAYPEGIPTGILSMDLDHSESLPGDHGITYKAKAQ